MVTTDPAQSAPAKATGEPADVARGKERALEIADQIKAKRGRLVQLAYRFVWSRSDAEDAVHNALILAQQKGDQLRSGAKWWSWVCRIVVRQCLLLRRRDMREPHSGHHHNQREGCAPYAQNGHPHLRELPSCG